MDEQFVSIGKAAKMLGMSIMIAIATACFAPIYGKRGGEKLGSAVRQAMATLAQEGASE
jgi:hypothetical protein